MLSFGKMERYFSMKLSPKPLASQVKERASCPRPQDYSRLEPTVSRLLSNFPARTPVVLQTQVPHPHATTQSLNVFWLLWNWRSLEESLGPACSVCISSCSDNLFAF